LSDGSVLPQWSYVPTVGPNNAVVTSYNDFADNIELPKDLPLREMKDGKMVKSEKTVSIDTEPTEGLLREMWFAWMVETGVTSNSVLTAKNLATVSIGVGGQDRVSMAKQCVSKAYESRRALFALQKYGMNYDLFKIEVDRGKHPRETLTELQTMALGGNAGLLGSVAASDAFFPFRDGVDVLLEEGVKAIVQPGGSLRDADAVQACNQYNATMVFTNMRCFKH
ncbi:hypothetical protein K8I31_00485, partial [bacterium]|nr:hypothetical protein [bacterium]